MTVGLCHLEGDPTEEAVMRIYQQIPIYGRQDADIGTPAQPVVPPEIWGELEFYKLLKGCPAVPWSLVMPREHRGSTNFFLGVCQIY